MKAIAWAILAFLFILLTTNIVDYVISDYQYKNDFLSYWNLADKASTLDQKSEYIDKFVDKLETSDLKGSHNALWLQTPDNSFDMNLNAVKSLQLRMNEIRNMDVTSFEYQQAIAQITAQEQGEAHHMLDIFEGCWYIKNHFILWDWVGTVVTIFLSLLFIGSICGVVAAYD